MHLALYAITFAGSWLLGWFFGTGASVWAMWMGLACAASGLYGLCVVPWPKPSDTSPAIVMSIAHRAWLTSSAACLLVFVAVGLGVGWRFNSLATPGLWLDPVGALGWTSTRIHQQMQVVGGVLAAGCVAFLVGGVRWWKRRQSFHSPVVLPWAISTGLWFMCLGLLIGLSQPWRNAKEAPQAVAWTRSAPNASNALAQQFLVQSKADPVAAVWAHALAIRAFEKGQMTPSQLDAFLLALARNNVARNAALTPWWPAPSKVGVDARQLCRARVMRPPADPANWATLQAPCDDLPPQSQWRWSAAKG